MSCRTASTRGDRPAHLLLQGRPPRRRVTTLAFPLVVVTATRIYLHCPRYIHRLELVERSRFVPAEGVETPIPGWRRSDWACDVLPKRDPARG